LAAEKDRQLAPAMQSRNHVVTPTNAPPLQDKPLKTP